MGRVIFGAMRDAVSGNVFGQSGEFVVCSRGLGLRCVDDAEKPTWVSHMDSIKPSDMALQPHAPIRDAGCQFEGAEPVAGKSPTVTGVILAVRTILMNLDIAGMPCWIGARA